MAYITLMAIWFFMGCFVIGCALDSNADKWIARQNSADAVLILVILLWPISIHIIHRRLKQENIEVSND